MARGGDARRERPVVAGRDTISREALGLVDDFLASLPPMVHDAAGSQVAGESYGVNMVAAAQQLALQLSGAQGMLMIPSVTGAPGWPPQNQGLGAGSLVGTLRVGCLRARHQTTYLWYHQSLGVPRAALLQVAGRPQAKRVRFAQRAESHRNE